MRYRIETAPDGKKLEEIVSNLLRVGWQVSGGISVSESWEPGGTSASGDIMGASYSQIFAQALVKPEGYIGSPSPL